MNKIIDNIFNNSRFVWFLLPIAIYNLVTSYIELLKQHKIVKDVINKNENFYKVLQTLGFTSNKFYGLITTFETDLEMTEDEIYDLANKQIILAVKNYLVDEMLFNVVKVEAYFSKFNEITVELNPANRKLFLLDIKNFIISLLVNLVIFGILFFYFFV